MSPHAVQHAAPQADSTDGDPPITIRTRNAFAAWTAPPGLQLRILIDGVQVHGQG